MLNRATVARQVAASGLPHAAREWLAESEYRDERDLRAAIQRAGKRVAEIRRDMAMTKQSAIDQKYQIGKTSREVQIHEISSPAFDELDKRYGLRR